MITVDVVDSSGVECTVINLHMMISKNLLRKVTKHPTINKWNLGQLYNREEKFIVDSNMDIFKFFKELGEAKEALEDELGIREMNEEHRMLDHLFSTLSLQRKKDIMQWTR